MSVQFGRWNFDGKPVDPGYVEKVRTVLAPYGPDGRYEYAEPGFHQLYFPFHTTQESRREKQPCVSAAGAVLIWDGRLDNREDLARELGTAASKHDADASIAAAAYDRWGTRTFQKLVGDWAACIWDPRKRMALLAEDFLGSRHLYYSLDSSGVIWSTLLDPLLLLNKKSLEIEEEYIAGWLSFFPRAHLTPYRGIYSVPPSCYIAVQDGKSTLNTHWEFDPSRSVRYKTDREYEEHFRSVLSLAVSRRLRSDAPVLAELSGGMDSSSIVCMADRVLSEGFAKGIRVDTVSFYDDSEPNWNEVPYFRKVEEKRGRTGCHIQVGSERGFLRDSDSAGLPMTPDSASHRTVALGQLKAYMTSQGHRVLLSGVGGDEVLGGVPTAIPELADLLAKARFGTLSTQLLAWALAKRQPVFELLKNTIHAFLPLDFSVWPRHRRPAPWLETEFVTRHRLALRGYETRLKFFGALPSFQENLATLDCLRRQIACSTPSPELLCDKRYPLLDRDLLEFLYAIPREQLVRPLERRSLMRRALNGIVPMEILNRKRKAFVIRGPLAALEMEAPGLAERTKHLACSALGIVNAKVFSDTLARVNDGQGFPIVPMLRTLALESWLRQLERSNFLRSLPSDRSRSATPGRSSCSLPSEVTP